MRRSFGSGNPGMGGSNSGNTQFLRTVSRAVTRPTTTTSIHEPFSANSPSSSVSSRSKQRRSSYSSTSAQSAVSSASGSTTPRNLPISAVTNPIMNYYRPSFPSPPSSVGDDFEWLVEDGGGAILSDDEFLFGPAPSVDEVQAAVSSLQQVIDPASLSRLVEFGYGSNGDSGASDHHSSSGSELDWIEPSSQMYTSRMLNSPGSNRIYDAFRLLQNDAAIQRMVVSLSSDRAVWNAVLNNEAVRELRGSLNPGVGDNGDARSDVEESDGSCGATNLLARVIETAKLKAMEIFDVINKIVSNLFNTEEEEDLPVCSSPLEEKLRQSVMLTVMVLLIVVVTRGNMA